MKHLLNILLVVGFLTLQNAYAEDTWVIDDTYIGGGYKSTYAQTTRTGYGDVIAGNSDLVYKFDIDSMTVNIDDYGTVKVSIATDYHPNIDNFGTNYGDLFISVDGWDKDINSTFNTTRTDWEYVFDTDAQSIYNLEDAHRNAYLLSQNFYGPGSGNKKPDTYYRKDQLVQIDKDKLKSDPLATAYETAFDDEVSGLLLYSFNLTDLGLSLSESYELAFRWTMTCANDVIEGSVNWQPVPEPETMVMMGIGLLGLCALGRRKLSPVRIRSKRRLK